MFFSGTGIEHRACRLAYAQHPVEWVMGKVFLRSRLKPNAVCVATTLDMWILYNVMLLNWICLPCHVVCHLNVALLGG